MESDKGINIGVLVCMGIEGRFNYGRIYEVGDVSGKLGGCYIWWE